MPRRCTWQVFAEPSILKVQRKNHTLLTSRSIVAEKYGSPDSQAELVVQPSESDYGSYLNWLFHADVSVQPRHARARSQPGHP